jgi:hypothetical protein
VTKHSAALHPFGVWPAAVVKHRGRLSSFRRRGRPEVARQFVIQPFGKDPRSRAIARYEILSSFARSGVLQRRLSATCQSAGNLAMRITRWAAMRFLQSSTPLAASHRFPTLRFVVVSRRTEGAGGFFLRSIRCSFRRSPSSRSLPIMFAGIWPALSGSSCSPDANSRPRSAPASDIAAAAWRARSITSFGNHTLLFYFD